MRVKKGKKPYSSIGIKTQNSDSLIRLLKAGLPATSFEKLQKELDISAKKLAVTVNIANRTLTRRQKEGKFKTDESERVLRVARLYDKAVEVFEDKNAAKQWFKIPAKALGGKTPLEYADTEPGAQEVFDLLGRIEHGVFS